MMERKYLAPPSNATFEGPPTMRMDIVQCDLRSLQNLWEFLSMLLPIDIVLTKLKRFHLVISK